PAVCEQVPPPHLSSSIDDRLSQAFAAFRQSRTTWKPVEVPLIAETEPACVRTIALLARAVETNADLVPTTAAKTAGLSTALETAAQACDDDAIRAQAFLLGANVNDVSNLRRAEAAAKQFPT